MAAFANGVSRVLFGLNINPAKSFLQQQSLFVNSRRNNFYFNYLSKGKEHNSTDYQYEVTNDPKDWQYVEKLLPLEIVPVPKPKSHYPSGWRPCKEEALQLPYFVERTKNHMLPVYLKIQKFGAAKRTKLTRIQGDLWGLHGDLTAYLQQTEGKKLASYVHEGNNTIYYRGDHVYYIEQWLLNKGF